VKTSVSIVYGAVKFLDTLLEFMDQGVVCGRWRCLHNGLLRKRLLRQALILLEMMAGVITSPFFGLGLYWIHPCLSRIEPVHDVVGIGLPPVWRRGVNMNKGYDERHKWFAWSIKRRGSR
jgi:hypothetical protein